MRSNVNKIKFSMTIDTAGVPLCSPTQRFTVQGKWLGYYRRTKTRRNTFRTHFSEYAVPVKCYRIKYSKLSRSRDH